MEFVPWVAGLTCQISGQLEVLTLGIQLDSAVDTIWNACAILMSPARRLRSRLGG